MIEHLPVVEWTDFFMSLILLGFLWILLQLISRFIDWIPMSYRWNQVWKEFLRFGFILMEPLTFAWISIVLVLITPLVFGPLLLGLCLIGFNHLRNYFTGLLLRLNRTIRPNIGITTFNRSGIVDRVGRSALYLQSEAGFERIPYHRLEQHGFVITEAFKGGRLRTLFVDVRDHASPLVQQKLVDLLSICPYVDWRHAPKVESDRVADSLKVSVFLKEDKFFPYLQTLLAERGFPTINKD